MLERNIEPNQLWSHYKHPDKPYIIKGINVASRETVADFLYFAIKEDTLEDLAVYLTVKGNLKLYKCKLDSEGKLAKLNGVIKEPHVIYQSTVDNKVWAREYDNFLGTVNVDPQVYLSLSGQFVCNFINRFERVQ